VVQRIAKRKGMMRRIFPLLIGLTLLLASCSNVASTSNKTRTITDGLGRQVIINSEPSRIVIVAKQAPMLTNFLYLFKTAGQKLLALEKRAQTPEDYLKLVDANIENKYLLEKGASAEQIVPLNPDVVILKSSMRNTIGKPLEDLSIPVVYVEFENIDQIYRDIRIFADILDEPKRGEEIIANYQTLFQQIQQKVQSNSSAAKPSVLILQAMATDQKYVFSIPAANWLQTDLVDKAGGIPVWKDSNESGGWTDVNMEQISVWNPDMIFIVNYQGNAQEIVSNLKNDQIWQNLKSVKKGYIYAFPYDYLSWDQPDPRWILGYGWLAYKINSQTISQSDTQLLITNFYKNFFLMSDATIQEKILPKISEYLK
jgi:iron complex transport system substrate-binding protein